MFDIGFPELLIVSIVALLVLGPERLPEALRTLGLWFGRMRRSFSAVKIEIEREIGMDEVRRQLHNEAILEEMRALETDVGKIGDNLNADLHTDLDNADQPDDGRSHADAGEAADELEDDATTDTAQLKSYTDDFDASDIVNEPHPDDRPTS